jgi:hypothetical protein
MIDDQLPLYSLESSDDPSTEPDPKEPTPCKNHHSNITG